VHLQSPSSYIKHKKDGKNDKPKAEKGDKLTVKMLEVRAVCA
jgi:hypothetical protein